jgi:hypothetical protein
MADWGNNDREPTECRPIHFDLATLVVLVDNDNSPQVLVLVERRLRRNVLGGY